MTCRRSRPGSAVALLAMFLVACGALESPVGEVTGRIYGASAGAYAYPLGRPDLKTSLVPSGAGYSTYTLPEVPIEVQSLVLYDGADRAELVPVHVTGGQVNAVAERYGAAAPVDELVRMPLAGTLLAVAVPEGGATPWQPSFTLPATDHGGLVPASGGIFNVYPLPAGRYTLGAKLAGFVPGTAFVDVSAGATMPGPVPLPVDLGAPAPGCGAVSSSAPAPCEGGLVCEPADGRCYECTTTNVVNCASGKCVAETHLCEPVALPQATYCAACTSSAGCATGLICRIALGSVTGYCTKAGCSSDADCPAGFDCSDSGVCRPPEGCTNWIQTMGSVCYSNERCHDALEGGWCQRTSYEAPGYCTAACGDTSDCRVGTLSTLVCIFGHCSP